MNVPTHEQVLRTLLTAVDWRDGDTGPYSDNTLRQTVSTELLALCEEALSHPPGASDRALKVMTNGVAAMVLTFDRLGPPDVATFKAVAAKMFGEALAASRDANYRPSPVIEEPPGPLHRSGFR
jgi:hypothetical protein